MVEMAARFFASPESTVPTPRFASHYGIPRTSTSKKQTSGTALSPKSVITDLRFGSPGSSSSSSRKGQPREHSSYSTSDGEFSDPDSVLDSTGHSRELGKSGHSGTLESLPETDSLALEDPNPNPHASGSVSAGAGIFRTSIPTTYRIPTFPAVKAERATPSRPSNRVSLTFTSELVSCAGNHLQSGEAQDQDGKISSSSSARRYRASESGSTTRRRIPTSRSAFSAELASNGRPLERGEDNKTERAEGPAMNLGYSGTPVRFFPSYNTHGYLASPRVQKADVGLQHRFLSGPLFGRMIPKPPPSKWDDAEKWIVSPGRKQSDKQTPHRSLQTLLTGRRHSIAGGQILHSHLVKHGPDAFPPKEKPQSEPAFVNAGEIEFPKRSNSQKRRSKALSFGDLSDMSIDASLAATGKPPTPEQQEEEDINATSGKEKDSFSSSKDPKMELFIVSDDKSMEFNDRPSLTHKIDEERQVAQQQRQHPVEEPQTVVVVDCVTIASSEYAKGIQVSKRRRSVSMQELSSMFGAAEVVSFPETKNSSQVAPVETLENLTCTTPGLSASPTRPNTPVQIRAYSLGAIPGAIDSLELQTRHMDQVEDRPSLDGSHIWTTREEEEMESAASLREDADDLDRFQLAAQATSWEEAEQAKAFARFRNKEAKIKAWEQHQKVLADAEMKRVQAKVEKILAGASEKMKERMASASKKAAEMTAAAEGVRNQQASKIAVRADLMRKAGLLSPSKTSFKGCFRVLRVS